jgi:hypothetical protein
MNTARTRTVDGERQRELVIEEYTMRGYRVVEEGEGSTVLRRRDHGGLAAHLLLFLVVGWWTLGLANLVYALYRRINSAEGVIVRVEEAEGE